MDIQIRSLLGEDWPAVARIYREGMETGDATFETVLPPWDVWDDGHHPRLRLVAEAQGVVVGFVAVRPVSGRAVYRGVAEVMVYVTASARGLGVGRRLMAALIEAAEAEGFWTLQAGMFPENRASVALHEAVGFRILGTHERLGRAADGRWRDVVRMERRSTRVGVE